MDNLLIREAYLTDIEDIVALDNETFTAPWSESAFFSELLNVACHYIVIYKDKDLIAFGGYQNIVGEGHITTMAVKPCFQSKGLGTLLMKNLIDSAIKEGISNLTLEVRVSNKKGISLYEKMGFKNCGVRKKYYIDNNEDAYIMWRFEDEA